MMRVPATFAKPARDWRAERAAAHRKYVAHQREILRWIEAHTPAGREPCWDYLARLARGTVYGRRALGDVTISLQQVWRKRGYYRSEAAETRWRGCPCERCE